MTLPPGPGAPAVGEAAPVPADLGRTAVRGTTVTLAAQALRVVLQFGSLAVLSRLLAPADFGLVAMAMAVVGVADILRDFGLNSAAVQAKTLSAAERSNLFWANTGLGAAAGLLAVAASPLIVALNREPRLTGVVLAVAVVFLVNGAATQFRADLSRSLRFSTLAAVDVAGQVLALVAAVAAAVAGLGYWAIVVQLNVVAVATLALSWWQSGFVPSRPRRDTSIRRFFRFGGGMVGTQLIAYATRNIDNVAIGAVWGKVVLGQYSRGYQLVMMPLNQINAPLTSIALPILSRVHEEPERYRRYLHRAQLVGCYLTAPLLAVVAGLAVPIVDVVLGGGQKWAAVAPMLAALAVGGVFRAVAQIAYWVFLAEGLTGSQFRMYLVTRPVVIAVMLAGLPWGGTGVAVTASVAYVLDWLVQMWWLSRVSKAPVGMLMRTALVGVLGAGLPAGLAAWAVSGLPLPSVVLLLLGVPAALAAIGLSALVVPRVRRDLVLMVSLVRSALRRRRGSAAR